MLFRVNSLGNLATMQHHRFRAIPYTCKEGASSVCTFLQQRRLLQQWQRRDNIDVVTITGVRLGLGIVSGLLCWSHWNMAIETKMYTRRAIPPTIANPGYVSK